MKLKTIVEVKSERELEKRPYPVVSDSGEHLSFKASPVEMHLAEMMARRLLYEDCIKFDQYINDGKINVAATLEIDNYDRY